MAEELEKLCGKITLTEGERVGVVICEGEIADGREKGERCLVGRIGGERRVNKEAFRSVLSRIWRLSGSVLFKEVLDNVWVFEFEEISDKRRVLEGRPWSFDRQILVLQEFDGTSPPSQLVFSHSPFWVQVHEMPLLCMNKAVGIKIGESLGEVEDIDVAGDGDGWGRCLRLRVNINLLEPLERGRALQVGGKSHWVVFKYEKLPMLCFDCGRIIHGRQGCPVPTHQKRTHEGRIKEWGVWMRAEEPRRGNGGGRDGGTTWSAEHGRNEGSSFKGWENKETFSSKGNPRRFNNSNEEANSKSSESCHKKEARLGGPRTEAEIQGKDMLYSGESGSINALAPQGEVGDDVAGSGNTASGIKNASKLAHVEGNKKVMNIPNSTQGGPTRTTINDVGQNKSYGGPTDINLARGEDEIDSVAMEDGEPVNNMRTVGPNISLRKWKRQARMQREGTMGVPRSGTYKRKAQDQEVGAVSARRAKKTCTEEADGSNEIMELAAAAMQPRQSQ